jgi:hypothetical protein
MRPESAVKELRGQLSHYRLDREGSVETRNRLVRANTLQDIQAILQPLMWS